MHNYTCFARIYVFFSSNIYEHLSFDKRLLYTSTSRSTKNDINLIDDKPEVSIGYNYTITEKHASYIGSTFDYKKRWKQHDHASEDMPLHRAIREQGIEKFTFEIVKI